MISNDIANKIKLYISANDFMTDKRLPTDAQLDKYIQENYAGDCTIDIVKEDFITYRINDDHIFIKDFVSFGNGIELLSGILKKASELQLPIRAMVHFSNTQVLNLALRRYKFEIIGVTSNQYILERR